MNSEVHIERRIKMENIFILIRKPSLLKVAISFTLDFKFFIHHECPHNENQCYLEKT